MSDPLKRVPDWRARFAAEMDQIRRSPFAWGGHDCLTGLALASVRAMTGQDLRATCGRYKTAAGAYRAIRKAGFDNLGDLVASVFEEIHPSRAHVGDLGLVPTTGEIGAGLVVFDTSGLITLTETGQGRLPRSDAIRAFKVG